jgi:8-oxo-dGTP diphosphatase
MSQKKQNDSEDYWPAVKAFILKNNNLLILKRTDDDIDKPGIWEVPGGKLDNKEEDKILGLIREVKEETNLDIENIKEFSQRKFTLDSGRKISMTIYKCNPIGDNVIISQEHTSYEWIPLEKAKTKITPFFVKEIDILLSKSNNY